MTPARRMAGILALLMISRLSMAQAPSRPNADDQPAAVGALITVQEFGGERRQYAVLSAALRPDGARAYDVQSVDTGERLTIVDLSVLGPAVKAPGTGSIRVRIVRVYHHGVPNPAVDGTIVEAMPGSAVGDLAGSREPGVDLLAAPDTTESARLSTTPGSAFPIRKGRVGTPGVTRPSASSYAGAGNLSPAGATPPAAPAGAPLPAVTQPIPPALRPVAVPAEAGMTRTNPARPATLAPSTGVADGNGLTGSRLQPAVPSDWRTSWGKADDHRSQRLSGRNLPHADLSRPDPLLNPEGYDHLAKKQWVDEDAWVKKLGGVSASPPSSAVVGMSGGTPHPGLPMATPVVQSVADTTIATGLHHTASGITGPALFKADVGSQAPATPGALPPAVLAFSAPRQESRPAPTARTTGPDVLIATLHDGSSAQRRVAAAEQLAGFDWRAQPAVVEALLTAARQESDTNVRLASIRALDRMHIDNFLVRNTLQALMLDRDASIHREATAALAHLVDRP